ncbi:hypothetical protein [Ralstonia pickettii]|uniref:Uncharacterized protein n=1 Tax=Ralstonia pickettii TaxID=329 RepID=A0AAW4QAJ3_RALPI|nr:hypothetical protein [Ralstonia pickettii]MBA9846860.1 hypothetical protein [Ralstonia pickettii]MBA9851988.1 hypothetical protein [Ralstonia pickettii]MBA9919997.1 hypothetical protein [Ralstonia pickettii]MBA9959099.1 hypothetical protein [Ralstonia pickettii]MBA9964523.1 hypothetical protein [Ralstonia pickettii]
MLTITNKDNLFSVIAAEVARSERSENYLIADGQFSAIWATSEIDRVLAIATSVAKCDVAVKALVAHYHTCETFKAFNPVFSDTCGGFIEVDKVVVEIRVLKISDSPLAYRVLFSRVDAVDLAIAMDERMGAIERRVQALETQGR